MRQSLHQPLRVARTKARFNLPTRLWRYQQERFPLVKHGLLIATFSGCALCLSALLRGAEDWPSWQSVLTAFGIVLLGFLQLRIADEHKDARNDARYRPERPVPRGLVTLAELRTVGLVTVLLQAALAFWLEPWLLVGLAVVWGYMGLMWIEFGVPAWLQAHPFTYLWSHMLIIPLLDGLATACDWLPQGVHPSAGLGWFLAVSFCNGIVIEIGRKTWAPMQERIGVESYSSAWGIPHAITVWLMALGLAFGGALVVAWQIDFFWPVLFTLSTMAMLLSWQAYRFVHQPTPSGAHRLETLAGLWVAGLYLILGIVPLGVRLWL